MDGFGNPQATVPPGGRAPCEAAKGRQLEHHECGTHLRAEPAANGKCTVHVLSCAAASVVLQQREHVLPLNGGSPRATTFLPDRSVPRDPATIHDVRHDRQLLTVPLPTADKGYMNRDFSSKGSHDVSPCKVRTTMFPPCKVKEG